MLCGFPGIPGGDPWIPWGDRWDLGTDGTLGPMGPGPRGPPILPPSCFIDTRPGQPGSWQPAPASEHHLLYLLYL